MTARLVWNAIVKNEAKVIARCVASLLPHIDGAIVVDTGSTDGTPDLLRGLFAAAGKPLEISPAPFVDFEQARNEALRCARLSRMEWDYLLLSDADMELKVLKDDWINGAQGLSYDLRQRAGSLVYFNRRLVSRLATGWYIGTTHEYLDVAGAGLLDGAEFVDHADGANRPDKFKRDIALLEKALETENRPGVIQRYHFYLGQSYFDAGNWSKAAEHYKIRYELGGYDEEVWNARVRYAHCLDNMGDQPGFLWEMLQAYWRRPHRAEALYDLAKFFRLRGENHSSLLFSEAGLTLPPTTDQLFVNDYVYRTGLKEEFAICAFYDKTRRDRGGKICDELALSKIGGDHSRFQARSNLFWYLKPLVEHVPSFRATRLQLSLPDGYVATNPSIVTHNGQTLAIVRAVNYTITPEGQYAILGTDGSYSSDHPIHTRNYLVRLSGALEVEESHELALPPNWPETKFDLVRGFEDSRLFSWDDQLWTLSTVRELTPEGWCEQVLAAVGTAGYAAGWKQVLPKLRRHEKNWMPWARADGALEIVYRLGEVIDVEGNILRKHDCALDVGQISGGSQVVSINQIHIALVHESKHIPGREIRFYWHRFVLLDDDGRLFAISPPFVFHDKQIEFAAGLTFEPETDKLIASYGVRDCEAWVAEMDFGEVVDFINGGQP